MLLLSTFNWVEIICDCDCGDNGDDDDDDDEDDDDNVVLVVVPDAIVVRAATFKIRTIQASMSSFLHDLMYRVPPAAARRESEELLTDNPSGAVTSGDPSESPPKVPLIRSSLTLKESSYVIPVEGMYGILLFLRTC